jgi:DEAD/DEAH box helicase domain-containing protein
LKCAAFELPFGARPEADAAPPERYACLGESDTEQALRFLGRHGVVHESAGRFHWSADAYPANHVSLRNIGWDNVVIIDRAMGRAIAELDWRSAHTMLHEQAIYQHDAEQFQVERLDLDNHKAYVTKVEPDYFTTAMVNRKVSILDESASLAHGPCTLAWGEVSVVEKVVGYKKIKFFTHENAGYGDVRLPDMQMHTTSFWLTIPDALLAPMGRAAAIDALAGVGRALETVATIALMCETHDIGQAVGAPTNPPSVHFDPTLFLFDHVPGGVGLAERIFELSKELLVRTRAMIASCACEQGCPACVGPPGAEVTDTVDRKRGALRLFSLALGG